MHIWYSPTLRMMLSVSLVSSSLYMLLNLFLFVLIKAVFGSWRDIIYLFHIGGGGGWIKIIKGHAPVTEWVSHEAGVEHRPPDSCKKTFIAKTAGLPMLMQRKPLNLLEVNIPCTLVLTIDTHLVICPFKEIISG